MVYIVLGIIGIVMIKSAIDRPCNHAFYDVSLGVGCSILATSIVTIFILAMIPESTQPEWDKWGLNKIHKKDEVIDYISVLNPKKHLDIIAFDPLIILNKFRTEKIVEALDKGLVIQILTPSIYMRSLSVENHFDQLRAASNDISKLEQWKMDVLDRVVNVKVDKDRCITIKYYDGYPIDFYCRIGGHVFVSPHSSGRTKNSEVFYQFFSKTEGAKLYSQLFDDLWEGNNKLFHITEKSPNMPYIDVSVAIKGIIRFFCKKLKEKLQVTVYGVVAIYKDELRRTFYSYKTDEHGNEQMDKHPSYPWDLGTIGLMEQRNTTSTIKISIFSDYENDLYFEMSNNRERCEIKRISGTESSIKTFPKRDTIGLLAVPLYMDDKIIGAFTFDFSKLPEEYQKKILTMQSKSEREVIDEDVCPELKEIFLAGNNCVELLTPLIGYGLDSNYYKLYSEDWQNS